MARYGPEEPKFGTAVRARDDRGLVVHANVRVIVGIVSPISYVLVLYAMQVAPMSHVAPAREVSMLFAALLGGHGFGCNASHCVGEPAAAFVSLASRRVFRGRLFGRRCGIAAADAGQEQTG